MSDAPTIPSSADLRAKCAEAASKLVDLRDRAADKRDDQWRIDVKDARDALLDFDALATNAERSEAHDMQRAAFDEAVRVAAEKGKNPSERGAQGPDAAFSVGGDQRTAGQIFTEHPNYVNRTGVRVGGDDDGGIEVRNLLTGSSVGTSGSHAFAPVGSPYLNAAAIRRMRLFVRDLIPVQQTGLQSVPYIRELNALTNESGAATVAEASAKTEVTMEFTTVDAPVRKIAAWIQATEEAFADAPTLRGYVDTRLAYMLAVEEEDQILNGNGTAPNLRGILQTTGVQTQAAVTDDLAATIGLAMAKVENVDGFADGVAINPITFWTGMVERHSSQMDGGVTDGGLPFSGIANIPLWGSPVVRTRSLAANKAVVGCWGIGATIFERMGTTIRSTDSHASLFISNTLVVLAEKRTALAVHRPDFFVDTTLAFT